MRAVDRNEPGWIYFLGAEGDDCPIKIGFTIRDPHRRLLDLQPGCWLPLKLYGAVPAMHMQERALHVQLADARVQGEWFKRDHALLILASLQEWHEAEDEFEALMAGEPVAP